MTENTITRINASLPALGQIIQEYFDLGYRLDEGSPFQLGWQYGINMTYADNAKADKQVVGRPKKDKA